MNKSSLFMIYCWIKWHIINYFVEWWQGCGKTQHFWVFEERSFASEDQPVTIQCRQSQCDRLWFNGKYWYTLFISFQGPFWSCDSLIYTAYAVDTHDVAINNSESHLNWPHIYNPHLLCCSEGYILRSKWITHFVWDISKNMHVIIFVVHLW